MVFNHRLYDHTQLTRTQVQGTTVLLHKKGDRSLPSNYRPISLVNTDVKVLTSVLAARMQPCAAHLVHEDQTGFIKGRSILHNIQRLDDTMDFVRRHAPDAVIAVLNFEKAFDRVNHTYLYTVLTKMGFHPRVVQVIKCLYSGRTSKILANGRLSPTFDIRRGVLQGDPLSPLLFVLALEPMCSLLRLHNHLGVRIGRSLHATSCFADDTQLFAASPAAHVAQLDLVDTFCTFSGFRLNRQKTQLITYGVVDVESRDLVVRPTDPVKALGILVAPKPSTQRPMRLRSLQVSRPLASVGPQHTVARG
jgi:hypothetical protein